MMTPLLEIQNLGIEYKRGQMRIPALLGADLTIQPGESWGVLGESGSGKSTLAHACLKLISKEEGHQTKGQILFKEQSLNQMNQESLRKIRGKEISMIFQDPFSALNPVLRIDDQMKEILVAHDMEISQDELSQQLRRVRLMDPERILLSYPHQLSGGQRQRVMIAMAILTRPQLLIADEPTSALDATVQKEILDLLIDIQKDLRMAMILITHNVHVAAYATENIIIMYAGQVVESGKTKEVLHNPQHPYTKGLLNSLPQGKRGEKLPTLKGSPPEPWSRPSGCSFHPRCPQVFEKCREKEPGIYQQQKTSVRCFLYDNDK